MSRKTILALSFLAATATTVAALAQDPPTLYPDNYKIVLENDRVRVLDFVLRKGATEKAHHHPAHVVYVITGFKVRFTLPNGQSVIRETKDGQLLWSDAVTHASENIGDTDAHGILVEIKTQQATKPSPVP